MHRKDIFIFVSLKSNYLKFIIASEDITQTLFRDILHLAFFLFFFFLFFFSPQCESLFYRPSRKKACKGVGVTSYIMQGKSLQCNSSKGHVMPLEDSES